MGIVKKEQDIVNLAKCVWCGEGCIFVLFLHFYFYFFIFFTSLVVITTAAVVVVVVAIFGVYVLIH